MANTVIDYKTVRCDLLTPGGWVLDGGCMGWGFASDMASRGMRVLAVDPAPRLAVPNLLGLEFANVALVGKERHRIGWVHQDEAECCYTSDDGGRQIPARTVPQLMAEYEIGHFDVVKLNVEGAEYEILKHWPGPIAKQITVSFHELVPGRNPEPKHYFELMLTHISQWYDVAQHERTLKGSESNYWDSLFILRT